MTIDPIVVLNLAFDLIILGLGVLVYERAKSRLIGLYVGVGFGLFAVSYLLTLGGFTDATYLVPIRTLGYLVIMAGLYLHLTRRQ